MTVVAFPIAVPGVVTVMRRCLVLYLRLGRTSGGWLSGLDGNCLLISDKERQRRRQDEESPDSLHTKSPKQKPSTPLIEA